MSSSRSSPPPTTPLKPNKRKIPPSIATQTPDKPSSTRHRSCHLSEINDYWNPANLGRYEMCEFFDSLDCSIRLLRLKGSMCSFTNICSKIESLTDRRFTYGHLGQLKYVMPEVIEVKRVNVFDERTSCMKPELCVSINVDAIECDENSILVSKHMHLRKVFRARLADFVNSHPEIDEVSEELLPEPFNPSTPALTSEFDAKYAHLDVFQNHESLSSEPLVESYQSAVSSHFAPSFCKHFSVKVVVNKDVRQSYISAPDSCHQEMSFDKSNGDNTKLAENEKLSAHSSSGVPSPRVAGKTIKRLNTRNGEDDSAKFQTTPAKFTSASLQFMSTTPALPPQRRCCMSPDEDSISSIDKLVRRAARPRSLKFEDPIESGEGNYVKDAYDDDESVVQ